MMQQQQQQQQQKMPASTAREELTLDAAELAAYEATSLLLQQPADFLAPFPSVVSLRDLVQEPLSGASSVAAVGSTSTSVAAVGSTSTSAGVGTTGVGSTSTSAEAAAVHPSSSAPQQQQQHQHQQHEAPTSLLSPNKGHHALFRALEELEGLEKEEATLMEHSPLTAPLTQVVTRRPTPTARSALLQLQAFMDSIPRRVCQHPFKRNDIVWVCRTCQADETCVLCHACFSQSHHEGHDVAFYHAQAGGCCDCGDGQAWDPRGFCPHHGPMTPEQQQQQQQQHAPATATAAAASPLAEDQVKQVRGVVPSIVDWMVQEIAQNAQAGYQRAMVLRKSDKPHTPSLPKTMDTEMTTITAMTTTDDNNNNTANISNSNDHDSAESSVNSAMDGDDDNEYAEYQDFVVLEDEDENDLLVVQDGIFLPSAASRSNSNSNSNANASSTRNDTTDSNASSVGATSHHNRNHPLPSSGQPLPVPSSSSSPSSSASVSASMPLGTAASWETASTLHASTRTTTPTTNIKHHKNRRPTFPEKLGEIGRQGHGLYLVLYADDIHSPSQWIDVLRAFLGASSYYTDSLLAKFVRALRQYGQLVVWGTMELVAECGTTNATLWLDGDLTASSLMANAMLKRAKKLIEHGFFCSLFTRSELQLEQRAVAVLQWMSALARSCDPLCKTVAESILPQRHLVPLLRADFKLSSRITKAWYSLLLTLLAIPSFKSALAAAYCDTYRNVTAKYAAGMGLLERSAYSLSVQFLNRIFYVVDLVQGRDLLGKLGKSLLETLKVARSKSLRGRLNPNHFVLSHRRYSPCVSDLKCVLNAGVRRIFACQEGSFLSDWVLCLSLAQCMDSQVWRHWTLGHVEDEARGWVGAFNLSISLGSLFERLLSWEDEEASPIKDPSSPLSRNLMSCMQLTYHILMWGVAPWQKSETNSCIPTLYTSAIDPHKRCPASLPFSTIAAKHGCALAMQQLPIAQETPFSFHLPLHRFLAACLREACLRQENGIESLLQLISSRLSEVEQDTLFRGLMEFPVLVLTRASQVRAGLWRRNGPGLNDQVLNYAEPPFCRSMRDADLLLVQFAVLKRTLYQCPTARPDSDVGIAFLVHLLLHRLGIFDFTGLTKAPNSNINRYVDEISRQLYPSELRPDAAIESDIVLPWTYSPARDAATRLVLLEEFLHLMVIFIIELPPLPPRDKDDHTSQAKDRLRREVIHRLASGPKTHSELSEVHLVLSHWDNVFLSEEGKLLNPDDATGAALGAVLEQVADRKSSRGKLEPDKWELRRSAWEAYDPSFFHISLRNHQTVAENRPSPPAAQSANSTNFFFRDAKSYGPGTLPAHPTFERLRRDATSDATVLAVAYRILHLHCRENNEKDVADLRGGKFAYENDERSETALARAVHILSLGAFAWEKATSDNGDWRSHGGGSVGSVFFDRPDTAGAPNVSDWIEAALLSDPGELLDCEWYTGEERAAVLLRRLAMDGGIPGSFVAGDRAVRSGAAWLCAFALKYSSAASAHLGANAPSAKAAGPNDEGSETLLQTKKRLAKEKALARMKEQAAKFASMMKVELEDGGQEDKDCHAGNCSTSFSTTGSDSAMQMSDVAPSLHQPARSASLGSSQSLSSASIDAESERSSNSRSLRTPTPEGGQAAYEASAIPNRLLKVRPQCIICNDESASDARARPSFEDDGHKRSRRRKIGSGNALGFVAYSQASTVLKGGGGPPSSLDSIMSPVRRFVGAHVALCGHAVHSECSQAYLAIVSHREDRVIGKRDEFRCPLCQRLSNCLVPFIDVGEDWICPPTSFSNGQADSTDANAKSDTKVDMLSDNEAEISSVSLQSFLSVTPWDVSKQNPHVVWDQHSSAFISKAAPPSTSDGAGDGGSQSDSIVIPLKARRRSVRSLRKKDLYAAWNAMMRTPRFVRRKFRHRSNTETGDSSLGQDVVSSYAADQEETTGETVVWRRFMDQVCDVAYRADSKRLGEDNLHSDFGEFRHYIVEKFSYNMAKRSVGIDPADWPSCVFSTTLSDTQRQELSREKLLSKLLMTIQAFTYSTCCEASEARRAVRKHMLSSREAAGISEPSSIDAVFSKFGITGVLCDGKVVVMPQPSSAMDDGSQPFNGRIGRLRYLALAVMAAAGAVAADLAQLVLSFPHNNTADQPDERDMDVEKPERAPIAYPILLGNVLTHVVAAMSAACGRARARSDSLELVWPVPFSVRGSFAFADGGNGRKRVDSVVEDCEGFVKLGLLARILQVILAVMEIPPSNMEKAVSVVVALKGVREFHDESTPALERTWVLSCLLLLEAAFVNHGVPEAARDVVANNVNIVKSFNEACVVAAGAACSFLVDISTILQVLIPGVMARYDCQAAQMASAELERDVSLRTFEKLRILFEVEPVHEMLQSSTVQEIIAHWFNAAHFHAKAATSTTVVSSTSGLDQGSSVGQRLYRSQGFRAYDWPMQSSLARKNHPGKPACSGGKMRFKSTEYEPQHEGSASTMQVESIAPAETPAAEVLRRDKSPTLVTFSAKKTVFLIGGYRGVAQAKVNNRPRIAVIPTSYTDLYAELGALLPDCEQTAVCLICGEVLNAGGKSECTRHSYKCGAGTGLFFLLQECSGLIMHKGKAAYIHSPYVDSHGETPQYRGRPLNLDLARYDHLREVWSGHSVRQQVLAERGSTRQVIVPDFY